jgi:cytochrome c-type biogenesis protein CcmE
VKSFETEFNHTGSGVGLHDFDYLCPVKKIHIILLLLVIAGIVGMSFFIKDLTTYETFASSAVTKDKFVVVKVQLDKSAPIEYDEIKDPNKTVFYAIDKDGKRSKVVYNNSKPTDIERSEGIDLNGYMRDGYFECTKLQMKCPSKYKDDMNQAKKNLPSGDNTEPKY